MTEGKNRFDREWDKFKLQRQHLLGFIQRVMIDGDMKPYLKDFDAEEFLKTVAQSREAKKTT